jgi:hypothetical protein
MKKHALLLFLAASALAAQTPAPMPTNFAAAGVSYGSGLAGSAIYAKAVDTTGTFSFTVLDAVPQSYKPFSVNTNISTGIAQRVATMKNIQIFVPGAAGVSFAGPSTGWSWTTGGMAAIPFKKYTIGPAVRVVKSSVSGGSGYQLIGSVTFGWSW